MSSSRAFAMFQCARRLNTRSVVRAFKHVDITKVGTTSRKSHSIAAFRPSSSRPARTCTATRRLHWTGSRPHPRFALRNFQCSSIRHSHSHGPLCHRAYVALGSNMGDRVAEIERACTMMESLGKAKILQTSSLYETKAMYVLDQDKFVNGACQIATSLSPIELLDYLQAVENKMGRHKVIDKGPRNIDLDILFYGRGNEGAVTMINWDDERLTIPHKLMFEREFVLRPLYEILHIKNNPSFDAFLRKRLDELQSDRPLSSMTPLGHGQSNLTPRLVERRTHVMSILNVTPDSFSDGGKNYDASVESLKETIKKHVQAGASIIDIGGQSTAPGSAQADSAQELRRVLPALEAIRSLGLKDVAISVDTYRADVAKKAIEAGAHIVNDISGGLMDEEMLSTVAELGCTVCLMHMRGTPETMNSLTDYDGHLIETVGQELLERVHAAEKAGIRRWRIILDPGIGFAKTQEQNLELLRRFDELRNYPGLENFPWLVGTSRKAFIGRVTGVEKANERIWGTAATVAAAVQGGADIVRVHDVKEMVQVTKMADAIWRVVDDDKHRVP
ncbi:Dihydropteroate synthase-like protein [Ampelomyces quisqualis]|uniref:Folic acid synthesis protein FOL1 n=1 Tax=Ampelomyces quisqualis TaxID=50730 RepID=A0A6A5QCC7_AMPQU|nr:Dihydropteroate synthase-like protein [Ampelomyces quisqualis]